MKKGFVKRVLAVIATAALTIGMASGCGTDATPDNSAASDNVAAQTESAGAEKETGTAAKGGKILYLSNLTSGSYYDFYVKFYENACADLGYDFEVIYGDMNNDPHGNLTAVRNAYTSNVVGLITCQDGGVENIMEEYPDMYVATLNSDMAAVFDADGTSHGALEKDHFLGTMADNYLTGEELGKAWADEVIKKGYKKIATCIFPVYAYPKFTEADAVLRAAIEAYNETADEKIEIVGDAEVLEFKPLDASFFLEEGNSDLDCIVGFCAGIQFVYPTLAAAKADGSCLADTKLITLGFEKNEDIMADCGDDKTIVSLTVEAPESALFPLVMIDNAVQGKPFADFTGPQRMSSGVLIINSNAAFEAMQANSPVWDIDLNKMQISWEDMKQYFTRYNENATYADLVEATTSIQMDGYMND